jgi:hypothetical protein
LVINKEGEIKREENVRERNVHRVWKDHLMERTYSKENVGGDIIKIEGVDWFIWLRIRTSGLCFRTRQWDLGFSKLEGNI